LDKLSDDKVEVRRAVILAIGKLGKNEYGAWDSLQKLTSDADPTSKIDVAIALVGISKPDAASIPTLVEGIGVKDQATQKAATRILCNLGTEQPDKVLPPLMEVLDKREQPAAGNALKVLRWMKEKASPALPKVVAMHDSPDALQRADVMDTVVAINERGDHAGDYAVPLLVKSLKEPDPLDRKEALMDLMKFRGRVDEFIGALVESLNDSDVENRLLAIGILRGLGQKGAIAAGKLTELAGDPDVRIKLSAISAVASFPPAQATLQALDRSIKDPDYRVRGASVAALKRLGATEPDKAVEILQKAMDSEKHEGTKRSMASAIESLKPPATSKEENLGNSAAKASGTSTGKAIR
jgi:HEAT repeat protein